MVGDASAAHGNILPFYWSAATGFENIGSPRDAYYDFGFGINDRSDVTGQFYTLPDGVVRAFTWDPGQANPHFIGALAGGLSSVGCAINNLRQITGTASTPDAKYDAFVWKKASGMRDIARVAGGSYTSGRGINDSGQVTGFGFDSIGRFIGFSWSQSTGMTLLQTLGGDQSGGFGINQSGAAAGYTTNASGLFHAAIWATNTSAPQDLGTLPGGANSYGQSINSAGQVAGYADVP